MDVKFFRKSGHKFFEFSDDGVTRSVCVDAWIDAKICPSFCRPRLANGWQPLADKCEVFDGDGVLTVICPTCFGYISSRGIYRRTGSYHMDLDLDKTGLSQFLYNYIIL